MHYLLNIFCITVLFVDLFVSCCFGFVGLFVSCCFGFVDLFVSCCFGFVGLFVSCCFGFVVDFDSDTDFGHSSDYCFDLVPEFVVVSEFGLIFGLQILEWSI